LSRCLPRAVPCTIGCGAGSFSPVSAVSAISLGDALNMVDRIPSSGQ
jgi:hypothetical protein